MTSAIDPVSKEDQVDVAHEALIRGWGRLRGWLDENREALLMHRRLTEAANEWHQDKRDDSYLYRGARLAEAEEWSVNHKDNFNPVEQAFLEASITARDQEIRAAEAQRQRELDQAQALTESVTQRANEQSKAARRFRFLAAILGVVFLIAVGLAVFAQQQRAVAEQAANNAMIAQQTAQAGEVEAMAAEQVARSAQATAEAQKADIEKANAEAMAAQAQAEVAAKKAIAGELASQSQNALTDNMPQISTLLAIEAFQAEIELGSNDTLADTARLWDALVNMGGQPLGTYNTPVQEVLLSPDDRWAVIVTGESLTIRDLDNRGAPKVELSIEDIPISGAEVSPDGRWLVVIGGSTVHVWTMSNLQAPPTLLQGHTDLILTLAISPDSRDLVTSSIDGTLHFWSLLDLQAEPFVMPVQNEPTQMIFTPDNFWLATVGQDDLAVQLWDLADLAADPLLFNSETDPIKMITVSPNGEWLIASGRQTFVWNIGPLADPNFLGELPPPTILAGRSFVSALTVSPDNRWLAVGATDHDVRLLPLDAINNEPVTFRGAEGAIMALAFTPDSQQLVVGSVDHMIYVWPLGRGEGSLLRTLSGHDGGVSSVSITSDSQSLISGSLDQTARVWDVSAQGQATEAPIIISESRPVEHFVIDSQSRWLVAETDSSLTMWDLSSVDASDSRPPKPQQPIDSQHRGSITNLALSADDRWLITGGGNGTIHVWDFSTAPDLQAPVRILDGQTDEITALEMSADSRWLAVGGEDGTIVLADLTTSDTPVLLTGHTGTVHALTFSADQQWLFTTGEDGLIQAWDLQTRDGTPTTLASFEDELVALVASPDNEWLVAAESGRQIHVWYVDDLFKQNPRPFTFSVALQEITVVAISPDSRWLVVSGEAGTTHIWEFATITDP
ncbi:MAG: hypothetical protein AAF485_23760, partial [Chloroflexota bacterium]